LNACRPVVFLDRDGTLNRARLIDGVSRPPAGVDELEILPGVAEALARLRAAGFRLVVATNQPDVARGETTRDEVERIHVALRAALPLDAIMACYHDDADGCTCRKPKPGLLLDAARRFDLDLGRGFMIGDRWRDIGAGRAAGCTTILLRRSYSGDQEEPDFVADGLPEATAIVLRHGVVRRDV
jgi:D-glycero-D-manno-heptose 1,7-bisphosphate phosphatase